MWDMYFQQTDPFLIFFLALIMLINGREQILAMKERSAEQIVKFLTDMPSKKENFKISVFVTLP